MQITAQLPKFWSKYQRARLSRRQLDPYTHARRFEQKSQREQRAGKRASRSCLLGKSVFRRPLFKQRKLDRTAAVGHAHQAEM
jgi:hypothetical protein